jgi:hypothetical protein
MWQGLAVSMGSTTYLWAPLGLPLGVFYFPLVDHCPRPDSARVFLAQHFSSLSLRTLTHPYFRSYAPLSVSFISVGGALFALHALFKAIAACIPFVVFPFSIRLEEELVVLFGLRQENVAHVYATSLVLRVECIGRGPAWRLAKNGAVQLKWWTLDGGHVSRLFPTCPGRGRKWLLS